MLLPDCIFCSRRLLELEGQFASLEAYLLDPVESAEVPCGECHLACLVKSEWAPLWAEGRAHHREEVLRQELVAQDGGTRAFRDRRDRAWAVVAATGELFTWRFGALRSARRGDGGRLIPVEEEYSLELPELPDLIAEVQAAIRTTKRSSLWSFIERLEIDDAMLYPAALADGAFLLDRSLQRYWSSTALSARVRYARFIPDEIAALVAGLED